MTKRYKENGVVNTGLFSLEECNDKKRSPAQRDRGGMVSIFVATVLYTIGIQCVALFLSYRIAVAGITAAWD